MVGIACQRVGAEDLLRPADRAEHVDPGLARRDRLDQDLVEVRPRHLGEGELDDAVAGVEGDPAAEGGQRVPVEPHAPPRDQGNAGHEEAEVQDELHHPLRPLRERLARVEVVEAEQVDDRKRGEEGEPDDGGARELRVPPLEAIPREEDEEDGGQDVRERERARELPLQLVERDREDRGEEQPVEHGLREHPFAASGLEGKRVRGHPRMVGRPPLIPLARPVRRTPPHAPARRALPPARSTRYRRTKTFHRPHASSSTAAPTNPTPSSCATRSFAEREVVEPTVGHVDGLSLDGRPRALLTRREPRGARGHRYQRVPDHDRRARAEPHRARPGSCRVSIRLACHRRPRG